MAEKCCSLQEEICTEHSHHSGLALEEFRENMPKPAELERTAELFKVLGDPTRMQILTALFDRELCVCDIADFLGMTQSAISHQLRILKQMQLIKFRREGKNILYSLADDHVRTILEMGLEHVME